MEPQGNGASSFTSAVSLDQLGVSSIPQRYVLPPSQRPSPHGPISTTIPIIDLSTLRDQSLFSKSTINEIRIACKEIGCFLVYTAPAQFVHHPTFLMHQTYIFTCIFLYICTCLIINYNFLSLYLYWI